MKTAKATKPVTSANALTQQVIRVLTLKGCFAWRCQSAGIWDPTKKVYRANSATKGISDVLAFHKSTGQIIAVEIKVNKDRLSVEQSAFLQAVNDAGGLARVIKTSEDIENLIKEL